MKVSKGRICGLDTQKMHVGDEEHHDMWSAWSLPVTNRWRSTTACMHVFVHVPPPPKPLGCACSRICMCLCRRHHHWSHWAVRVYVHAHELKPILWHTQNCTSSCIYMHSTWRDIYYCARGLQVTEFYTCNRASMLRPTLLYLFYSRKLFETWRISHFFLIRKQKHTRHTNNIIFKQHQMLLLLTTIMCMHT